MARRNIYAVASSLQSSNIKFKIVAADSEAGYFKSWLELLAGYRVITELAQLAHWNIKGSNFKELHSFFEGIYALTFHLQDRTAEHILSLYPEYAIPDGDLFGVDGFVPRYKNKKNSVKAHVKIMYLSLSKINSRLVEMAKLAEENSDISGESMLGSMSEDISKFRWMPKAQLTKS